MTKKQKNAVKVIVSGDCRIAGSYCNANNDTCAVGALLLAAGVTNDQLRAARSDEIRHWPSWLKLLEDKFGISLEVACEIQERNDDFDSVETRRETILEYLETIPVENSP